MAEHISSSRASGYLFATSPAFRTPRVPSATDRTGSRSSSGFKGVLRASATGRRGLQRPGERRLDQRRSGRETEGSGEGRRERDVDIGNLLVSGAAEASRIRPGRNPEACDEGRLYPAGTSEIHTEGGLDSVSRARTPECPFQPARSSARTKSILRLARGNGRGLAGPDTKARRTSPSRFFPQLSQTTPKPRAVRAGGESGRRALASEHPLDLRLRPGGEHHVRRHGAAPR